MSTSSAVFVVLVVFATTVPIAIFAWVAGKKHRKVRPAAPDNTHQSVKQGDPPRFRQREAWADEAADLSTARGQKPTSERPQHGACLNGTASATTRRRTSLSSSTTQWDRADTMDTLRHAPHEHVNADHKERQDN